MIEVRQPSLDELPGILLLRYRVLDAPRNLEFDDSPDKEDLDPTTLHVAAFAGTEPVSTLRVEQHPEYGSYVRRMATDAAYAGRGIGRQVLRAAEILARVRGSTTFTLYSRPGSEEFYRKCGYLSTPAYNSDEYGKYPQMIKDITRES